MHLAHSPLHTTPSPLFGLPTMEGDQVPQKFPKICEICDGSRPAPTPLCLHLQKRVPCRSPISSISINTYSQGGSFGTFGAQDIGFRSRRAKLVCSGPPTTRAVSARAFNTPNRLPSADLPPYPAAAGNFASFKSFASLFCPCYQLGNEWHWRDARIRFPLY